jgi:hypothetical protein
MGMLRAVDRDLWVAEQPLRYFGLSIGTRMTVVRLAGGDLVVISPIQPADGLVEEIAVIGPVRHIVAPNLYHYRYAAAFKAIYPDAVLWASAGLRGKRPELPIDRPLEPARQSPWTGLDCLFFPGLQTLAPSGPDPLEEWVFCHTASRTLILTDIAFRFDDSFPWLTRLITRLGGSYDSLSPSLLERVATKDDAQVRASVEQVLRWEFERVIVAHGSIVEIGGKAQFKQGYEAFLAGSR